VTAVPRTEVAPAPAASQSDGLEIVFRPDASVWDGRFANNGWLQELPKPHTKLTWDNAAHISPVTAQRLGLQNEDLVELSYRGKSVKAPIWIVPGHANDCVVVHLGYGRKRAGRVGDGNGFDANTIRTSDAPYFGRGLNIRKLGGRYRLACTQDHHSMEGRDIVRFGNNQDYLKNAKMFVNEEKESDQVTLSLYPEWQYPGYRWGMAIDQNACIGCNSCVVACQAENNIAVVGKEQVLKSREMHWIRIDRYHSGSLDNPESHFQPMLCQHCEKAPCEPVCPVAATVHSSEGLSQMIYNRCVGTRYCSNNCPYKVRRFNFLLFQDWDTPSLEPLRNPDVTVRSRGVMEKCSFCIQRIWAAKIESEKEDRRIADGEVLVACQSACPTDAIVFGDLNDEHSRVRRLAEHPLSYSLLAELSTSPRIKYMAKLRNPNPEMGNA
ncbi:MAG TPA: 4Fe-4S dicluster domain-containing protein, partial [Bryobacteraceae bacterium]|nr:4Fe-4S dicluster domain-containing protein [Bryobacteraceae bacterium]